MTPLRANQLLKIAIVMIVLGIFGVMYLGDNKLAQMAEKTSRLKAQAMVNEKQIATYRQTEAKVGSLQYVNELAARVLPPEQEQSVIVAEVSAFAVRSQLEIEQINFIDAANKKVSGTPKSTLSIPKGVEVVPINIQFKPGSQYSNILEFLKTIESNRRKMQVTNVSLTPNPDNRQELNQVSIALNLYAKQETAKNSKRSSP